MKALEPGSNALIIAPQWIGDAVMTEPLLRRLHARGEQLTVGALPWVAPVYRAMPQVAAVIEFPFQHGGLQFKARRLLAQAKRLPAPPWQPVSLLEKISQGGSRGRPWRPR